MVLGPNAQKKKMDLRVLDKRRRAYLVDFPHRLFVPGPLKSLGFELKLHKIPKFHPPTAGTAQRNTGGEKYQKGSEIKQQGHRKPRTN